MAELITRFRVNVNGVEQDAQVCYKNLANKPTFKTINGKAVIVSSGDTETDLKLATQEETAALNNRVANLEQNGTGSGAAYDDTEVRALITAEQNRATAKEAELEKAVEKAESDIRKFTAYFDYVEVNFAKKTDVSNLEGRVETLENNSGSSSNNGGSGSVDLNNYYTKEETEALHNALVNKTGAQEITGEKNFCGKVSFYDVVNDKDNSVGTSGQILSSTGSGVKWVDAPSTDLSNYYTKAEIGELLDDKANATALNNYYNKAATEELIDEKIAAALAAIPVAEGGAY